ncbi:hypothetical protein [Paenibacillus alvei]|uniref:hypothetical protein n=1 Tax=Paenibacillus alvei TaxID=44250 RepID=UPI000287CE32|nr:hypothetical protein [Paenibacillus alvei]EJW14737.1 hypothetical protein PAV_11c00780 [Paenibacillus alvei DSM 29]MCY9540934.1 hypothetical protein [Paenibacillus alvei]MCY9708162.1 hypothetical protein [Paenibacillus alvei]MEC0080205.1 hypothetical protein [Paenibacillus alvei]NEZ43324.1 hypothetical protein [Paenibacillus alvei]
MKWIIVRIYNDYEVSVDEFETYDEAKAEYDSRNNENSLFEKIYLAKIEESSEPSRQ